MSNVFVACEAITELTGSELAMLRALPGQGLADLSETHRQWCELQAGHGGSHVSLTQLVSAVDRTSHEVRDEWWWLRWDRLERSLAAVPSCPASVGASDAVDNGTCGLPRGHRGEHEYEFADPQLVYMGGYALTARVTEALAGEPDGPAVVFVNALGSSMTRWDLVRQRLRGRYRLITYDRAGTGQSRDRPSDLRQVTYRDLAAELVQLLDRLQQTGRVVLVGHSIGSLIVRVAASEWPQRIAGVVHVDGTIPELVEAVDEEGHCVDGDDDAGCARIDHTVGTAEVNAAAPPLVPGIVLVKSRGYHPEMSPKDEEDWSTGQAALTAASGAVRVDALNAGHFLQTDEPDLVAFAVRAVVAAAQAGTSTPTLTEDAARSVGGTLGGPVTAGPAAT